MYNRYMKKYSRLFLKIGIILILLFIDLWSKSLMEDLTKNGILDFETGLTIIPHILYFNYQSNTGAAFSLFSGQTIFLIIFTIVMLAVMVVVDCKLHTKNDWFYVGMILFYAGGIGNLVDRIFLGHVRDFIYLTFFPSVFNFADICLVVGIICIIVYILFYYSKEKQLPQKESMTELQEEQQKLDGIKERKVKDGRVVEKSQYEKEEHVEKWDDDKDTDQRK